MTNESAGENTTATTASKTTGSSETQVASGRNSCRNSNVRRLLLEVARKSYIQAHNAWVTSLPPVTATAPQSGDLIGLGFGTRRNYTGVRVDGADSAFVFADAAHTDERRAEHGSFYIEGDDGNKYCLPDGVEMYWELADRRATATAETRSQQDPEHSVGEKHCTFFRGS